MPVNSCSPCSDLCYLYAQANNPQTFMQTVLQLLCNAQAAVTPLAANLVPINGTYTGTDQVVLASPGAGFKYKIRSLVGGTEDANTDWRMGSKVGVAATVHKTPNMDYLSNAGAVLNDNPNGWFRTDDNGALVITSNGNVDLFGTAEIIAA